LVVEEEEGFDKASQDKERGEAFGKGKIEDDKKAEKKNPPSFLSGARLIRLLGFQSV